MLNPSQLGVALHIKTSHFICRAKHLTSFYMKYIAGLKWSKIQLKFDLTFGKTYCSARNVNCNNKTFTDVYPSLRKKASVFGVILVRISPAFGLNTERYGDTKYLSVFSPCGKNADQNNSENGHFLRSNLQESF